MEYVSAEIWEKIPEDIKKDDKFSADQLLTME